MMVRVQPTDKLDGLPNSFEKMNRVRCFNHMMQLSVKSSSQAVHLTMDIMTTVDSDDQDDKRHCLRILRMRSRMMMLKRSMMMTTRKILLTS
jgi:hypothetical protein